MSLLTVRSYRSDCRQLEVLGAEYIKRAAEATSVYSLAGRLYLSSSGWLLLAVPNALVRGAFQALHEPGAELPPDFTAHISVMRPEEIEQLGGPDKINERGKVFRYQLGPLKTVTPAGWGDMSKVWFISIVSPELAALRRSYGLSSVPRRGGEDIPFHLTVATRRKNVLTTNDVRKAAAELCPICGKAECDCTCEKASGVVDAVLDFTEPLGPSHRSFIMSAIRETPFEWHPRMGLIGSLYKHVQRIRQTARSRIAEQNALVAARTKDDKDYGRAVRLHELQGEPDTAEPGWLERPLLGLPSEPLIVAPHHKRASMLSGTHFAKAMQTTPLQYDASSGVLDNLLNHVRRVQATARAQWEGPNQALSWVMSTHPDYARQRFIGSLLSGKPVFQQPGAVDHLLTSVPLGTVGKTANCQAAQQLASRIKARLQQRKEPSQLPPGRGQPT